MRGRYVALALLVGLAARVEAASELRIRTAAGRVLGSLAVEKLQPDSDELYVASNALVDALDLQVVWKPETRILTLAAGDAQVQVTVDTRLVRDGDQETMLRVPVLYKRGSVMLPLEFVSRILAPHLGRGASFDRTTLELVTAPVDADVLGVDAAAVPDGAQLRLHLAREIGYRAEMTSKSMLRVQIPSARLDPVALAADRPTPLVRSVRAEQRGADATLFFELAPECTGFTSRAEDDGRTIVLELRRGTSPAPVAARAPVLRDMVDVSGASDSFDVVVLDPGHGGFDRGARGNDLEEKNVTLDFARALQPVLERELGVRVLLVRNGDVTCSPETRAETANRNLGDVFVSLHCNAWPNTSARGMQVSYAPLERSTMADAALASSHRGVTDFVPWQAAHLPYADLSRRLADLVAAEFGSRLDVPTRPVRPAAIEVLEGAAMPSILIELGFVTNGDDAHHLKDPEFQTQVADALVAALRAFRTARGEARAHERQGGAR